MFPAGSGDFKLRGGGAHFNYIPVANAYRIKLRIGVERLWGEMSFSQWHPRQMTLKIMAHQMRHFFGVDARF